MRAPSIPFYTLCLLLLAAPVWAEEATGSIPASASIPVAPATASEEVMLPPPVDAFDGLPKVDVIYTGFSQGFASGRFQINELAPLYDERLGKTFSIGSPKTAYGVFRCGKYFIFSPEGPITFAQFKTFLESGVEMQATGEKVSVLNSDYSVIFQYPQQEKAWVTGWLWEVSKEAGQFPDQDAKTATVYTLKGKDKSLSLLSLSNDLPPASLLASPGMWETSPILTATATRGKKETTLFTFGKIYGDGLRRRELIKKLMADKQGTLLVDAGNLVNAGNSEPDQLERSITFKTLADLKYDAVLPFINELSLDRASFEKMGQLVPFVAANLQSKTVRPILRSVIKNVRGIKVGITGVSDEQALTQAGLVGGDNDWTATEPIKAAKEVVAELKEQGVDFILMLANLSDSQLYQLRDQVAGIGVVVGQFSSNDKGLREEEIEIKDAERMRQARAQLLTLSGPEKIGFLEASFDENSKALERILHSTMPLSDDLPFDEKLRLKISTLSDSYFTARSMTLMPDIRRITSDNPLFKEEDGTYPSGMRPRLWSGLVSNVLRQSAGADIGIARQVPNGGSTIGEIPRFFVERWLDVNDRVIRCELSGADLKKLYSLDKGKILAFTGFDKEKNLVAGRPLDEKQLYQVATTDVIRHLFSGTFEGKAVQDHFQSKGRPLQPGGDRLLLKDLVLGTLMELAKAHPEFDAPYLAELGALLDTKNQEMPPQLALKLDEIALLFNNNQVRTQGDYGQVRNSRVNNPGSDSLGGKLRFSLEYDTESVAWENKIKSAFTQNVMHPLGKPEVKQESDDDINLQSEFRLKFVKLDMPKASMELVPFINATYDTEWTPTTDATTGKLNRRQSEINGIGGLVLYPGGEWKEVRLGGLLRHDFAATKGGFKPGFQLASTFERRFNDVLFNLTMDTKQIFRTLDDTPEELGLTSNWVGTVSVPLWGGFNLNFTTDAFFFNGKLASNQAIGTNLKTLVGLSYRTQWRTKI